mgnify:CR=1 FL=1
MSPAYIRKMGHLFPEKNIDKAAIARLQKTINIPFILEDFNFERRIY